MPPEESPIVPSSQATAEPPPAVVPSPAGKGAAVASEPGAEPQKPSVKDIGDFARRRHALSNQAKEVKAEKRAIEAQRAEWTKEREASNKRVADLEAKIESLAKGNPLLREGVDPDKTIQEFLKAGTPEAKAFDLERRLNEERDARTRLEADIKTEREERTKAAAEAQKRAAAQEEHGALQNFTRVVTGAEKTQFPYLNSEFSPEEIFAMATEVHEGGKKSGKQYSFEVVGKHLEDHAKKVYAWREDRRKVNLGGSQEAPPAPASRVQTPPGNGRRATVQQPHAVAPKPKVPDRRLTRDEEEAADLEMLRRANAADAADRAKREKTTLGR